jgi:hypothetical protein
MKVVILASDLGARFASGQLQIGVISYRDNEVMWYLPEV